MPDAPTPAPAPKTPVAISIPQAIGKVLLALALAAGIGLAGYALHAHLHPTPTPDPVPVPTPTPEPPKPEPPKPPPTPAAVTIVVPAKIEPDSLVRLRLTAPVAESVWEILHGKDITLAIDHEDGPGSTVFAGPPGPYRASAWYLLDGHLRHTSAGLTIPGTPTPPPPDPKPDPTPKPDPPPTPGPIPPPPPAPKIVGKFWAVAVVDTNTLVSLPPGQRDLHASSTIAASVAAFGGTWKQFDAADPLVASTAWGKAATAAGIPALVYVDEKGGIVKAEKLPADEATVVAEAKSLAGK